MTWSSPTSLEVSLKKSTSPSCSAIGTSASLPFCSAFSISCLPGIFMLPSSKHLVSRRVVRFYPVTPLVLTDPRGTEPPLRASCAVVQGSKERNARLSRALHVTLEQILL